MNRYATRREFMRQVGLSPAVFPFLLNLPELHIASNEKNETPRKQRIIFMFSPNGVVPKTFWPEKDGAKFSLPESLAPLEPFKDRSLILHGLCNKIKSDGDGHLRGIGCLLTGTELFPGNIQGGSDTPAGWAKGISIDQEIATFLQNNPATKTRYGSLEFGVQVPDRADPWTRWCYAGPNQPLTPISDPYHMLHKLYGQQKDQKLLGSVLNSVQRDLHTLSKNLSQHDRRLLEQHTDFISAAEKQARALNTEEKIRQAPPIAAGIKNKDENMPKLSRMQIDVLVHSLESDYCRVASLQYTNSVSNVKMTWLNIHEGHHTLSHEPDNKIDVQNQLTKINAWYCHELVYLLTRLAETKDPGTNHRLLDNTLVVWTNELGKGNSHTRDNLPFILAGNGLNFTMGRMVKYNQICHNRLLLALAHGFGHRLETFGNKVYSQGGALDNLV
jgi:Protein of unknown function (DUF1552)